MKKLISSILFSLIGLVSYGQSKNITLLIYKDGKVIGTHKVPMPTEKVKEKVVTKIKYVKVKSKPEVVTVKEIEYKLVPVPTMPTALDTIAILQKYYPRNIYTDVIKLHNNVGEIAITDTIAHNRLVGRSWQATIRMKQDPLPLAEFSNRDANWFMGPYITTNFIQEFQSFGVSVVRKGKEDNLLQFTFGGNVHEGKIRSNAYFGLGYLLRLK